MQSMELLVYVLACVREIDLEYSQPGNEVHFVSANIVTQRTMFISDLIAQQVYTRCKAIQHSSMHVTILKLSSITENF